MFSQNPSVVVIHLFADGSLSFGNVIFPSRSDDLSPHTCINAVASVFVERYGFFRCTEYVDTWEWDTLCVLLSI